MHPSSKWLTIDTSKQSPNYVTVGNSNYQTNMNSFTQKGSQKVQQTVFKSNLMSRYSSQQDLQSYARPKLIQQTQMSPKSQHQIMFKKGNFIPRKSNNLQQKGTSSNIVKRRSNVIPNNQPIGYLKSPYQQIKVQQQIKAQQQVKTTIQQKGLKHLKETYSTNMTENVSYGTKSEKTIPSFLKNVQNKRKNQDVMKGSKIWNNKHLHKDQVTIDQFQIVQKLGEGKFGNVFLAVEKATRLMVALKMVQKKRVIDDNFLTQFIRQIKIQAFLQHPNIAKVYGFFQDAQYFYSILEFGQGGQLYDIIKNGQTLSQQSTSFIIGNLLDAVTYLHDNKILHRDIKPQNIVLVHGNVKLCDFGWAVYKKGELRSTFCGTPLYLSPQLLNGEKYDEKVDLWAIGILAFQLHLGSSPFNIESQEDLLKIITNQIEYPDNCHVSKNFKQFIGSVLRKDPKQRLDAKQLMDLKFIKRYRELQTCQQLCQ